MERYTFPCGCSFPVLGEPLVPGGFPRLDFSFENIRRDCPAVYAMASAGDTVGVFQLDKPLGQDWAKKLRPETLEHIAALGALLRPGPLNSKDERGVSMAEQYCRRKNAMEDPDYVCAALEQHLKNTYGIIPYQEIIMQIAADVCGFNDVDVDKLRKGIGKKDYKVISSLKEMFLGGAARVGKISAEHARLVWSWIEKCGRYLFNKAHAVEYALISYEDLFAKAHNCVYFYATRLAGASLTSGNLREKLSILVEDARRHAVPILPPSIVSSAAHFSTDSISVRYGLSDIKGIGEKTHAVMEAIICGVERLTGVPRGDLPWFDFYVLCLSRLSRTVVANLIAAGACACFGLPRARMLAEHEIFCDLSAADQEWIYELVELRYSRSDGSAERRRLQEAITERDAAKAAGAPVGSALTRELSGLRRRLACIEGCAGVELADMEDALARLAELASKKPDVILGHLAILQNPPTPLVDSVRSIVAAEEELLGVALTAHRTEQVDLSQANCSVADFLAGRQGQLFLGVEVVSVAQKVTRGGKTPGARMCQVVLADGTGKVSGVCFPEDYRQFGHLLTERAIVLVQAQRGRDRGQVVVKRVWLPQE